MKMKSLSTVMLAAALFQAGTTFAQMPAMHMEHAQHAHHAFAFGRPAQEADVTKTIHVEANDQMRLHFDSMEIRRGDVVKFVVKNVGQVPHEFAIGDDAFRREHMNEMKQMAAMPGMAGMEHSDPNVVSVQPGETKTLVWRFDPLHTRNVLFACYVPGHYEAGMYQRIVIAN